MKAAPLFFGDDISCGPAMAMTTPVRVVVFVFAIICLTCSFAVCTVTPMASAISLLVQPFRSIPATVISLGVS